MNRGDSINKIKVSPPFEATLYTHFKFCQSLSCFGNQTWFSPQPILLVDLKDPSFRHPSQAQDGSIRDDRSVLETGREAAAIRIIIYLAIKFFRIAAASLHHHKNDLSSRSAARDLILKKPINYKRPFNIQFIL